MIEKKAKIGINDSDKAKNHFSQNLFFEKNAEAKRIVEFFADHFKMTLTLKWRKKTGSTMGYASRDWAGNRAITLFIGGDSIATLLHEIAHHVQWDREEFSDHGPNFHAAQNEVLGIFDLNAHKMILDFEPTMAFHANEVIVNSEKIDRDIDGCLRGYSLLNKIDRDELEIAVLEQLN